MTLPMQAAAFRALPRAEKIAFLESLPDDEAYALFYDWYGFWARSAQQIPAGEWTIWICLAGRGFGKTRVGSEWVIHKAAHGGRRGALVARTKPDIRDTMIEGESGILTISPPHFRPIWEPSKRRLTWSNGCIATCYSADEPKQLEGPQHDFAWGDELGGWPIPTKVGEKSAYDNLMFGLRLLGAGGEEPQAVFTSTPRRGSLLRKARKAPGVVVTGGSSYENRENLAETYFQQVIVPYEGTRMGQQELYAIEQEDNPDSLWSTSLLEETRRSGAPRLKYIVVGVDPEGVSTEESAETGIIVVGRGYDGHGYVLADYTVRGTPAVWGQAVLDAYAKHQANKIVVEVNNGGEMVEYVIKSLDPTVPVESVRASRGKLTRAEPVSALYEKRRMHHVGVLPELENQLTQWLPGEKSPDRLDALVWAVWRVMLKKAVRGRPHAGRPRPPLSGLRI